MLKYNSFIKEEFELSEFDKRLSNLLRASKFKKGDTVWYVAEFQMLSKYYGENEVINTYEDGNGLIWYALRNKKSGKEIKWINREDLYSTEKEYKDKKNEFNNNRKERDEEKIRKAEAKQKFLDDMKQFDPYGEEEWDDMLKESKDYECKFFNGDSCSYEDYASGQSEDGYCLVDSKGCDTFTIKPKVKKTKRVYTKEDPYGEEEWSDVKENNDFDPYGEEEWDYDDIWMEAPNDYKFEQGEEVRLRPDGFYARGRGINGGLVGRIGVILNKPKKRTWPEAFEWDVRFDGGQTRNYRTIDLMCKRKEAVLERKIPYKKTLCQDLWEDDKLIERIREKLIKIAKDFFNDVELETEIKDIHLTGSMANYNYTEESDIDVHIVCDFKDINEDTDLVKKAIDGQRFIWNLRHNIVIKGHDVELYIQDETEEHNATGLYSLLNDEWITKPVYNPPNVDTKDVNVKYDARVYDILKYEKLSKQDLSPEEAEEYYENANELKSKIMKSRKEGLTEEGEFSIENLVFKKLRKEGKIKKIIDVITRFYDKIYSQ